MGHIKLADEDRERYGAPELIPFESGRWGLKSVDALEQQAGWTMEDLSNGLRRKTTQDETDEGGDPVLDEDGKPKQIEVPSPRPLALAAVVWLALRGVGIRVPWDEFDVSLSGLVIKWTDDDEGKAPEDQDSATTSTSS